jgi:hypothetical protein
MEDEEYHKNKTRHIKWIIPVAITAAILILLAAAPSILSTQFGFRQLTKLAHLDGSLTTKEIHLSWFGEQKLEEVEYKSKTSVVSITSIISQRSLTDYIFNSGREKEIEIINPKVELNVARKQNGAKAPLILFSQNFRIKNGSAKIILPSSKSVSLDTVDIVFSSPVNHLQAKGKTKEGRSIGSFSLDAHANIDKHGEFRSGTVTGNIAAFPVVVLDKLLSTEGLYTSAIGQTLNGNIHCLVAPPKIECTLKADAQNLQLDIQTRDLGNQIMVDPNSSCLWTVTPQFFKKLALNTEIYDKLAINGPTEISLTPDNIILAAKTNALKYSELQGAVHAKFSPVTFSGPGLHGPLTINEGTLDLQTRSNHNDLITKIDGALSYGAVLRSPFSAMFTLINAFNLKESIHHHTLLENIQIQASNFPIILLDHLSSEKTYLSDYLGQSLYLDLSPQVNNSLKCSLNTTNLHIDDLDFSITNIAKLGSPVKYTYIIPTIFKKNYKHIQLGNISGELSRLELPMNPWGKHLRKIILFTDTESAFLNLKLGGEYGPITMNKPKLSTHINSFDNIETKSNVQVQFPEKRSLLQSLFGPHLAIDLQSTLDLKQMAMPSFDLKMKSDRLNGKLEGSLYDKFTKVRLNDPLHLEMIPSSEFLNSTFLPTNAPFSYTPYEPLKITIKRANFDLLPFSTENLDIEIEYSLPGIALLPQRGDPLYELRKNTGKLYSKKGELQVALSGKGYPHKGNSSSGKYAYQIATDKLLEFQKMNFEGNLKLHDIPNNLLDLMTGQEKHLQSLFGETTSLNAKLSQTLPSLNFTADIDSSRFKASGSFILGGSLQILQPAKFKWELDNDGFVELTKGKQPFTLKDTTTFQGTISHLDIPLQEKANLGSIKYSFGKYASSLSLNPDTMQIIANAQANRIVVRNEKFHEEAEFYKPTLSINKKTSNEPFALLLKSDVKALENGKKGKAGTIQASLHMQPSQNDMKTRFDLLATFRNFPALLGDVALQSFSDSSIPLSYITGPTLSGNIKSQIDGGRGKLEVNLSSPGCKAEIIGDVLDGELTLTKPLNASLVPSKRLGDLLLSKYDIAFVGAQKPITLRISPNDTRIPLQKFALKKLTLPYIFLDLGKITCRNTGNPLAVSSLFKLNIKSNDLITLWFAPIEARMRRSTLSIDRTEILFNNTYEIATWGNIDFKDRYVSMILGLTAQSLSRALGIRNLPSDFVIPIPFSGPFGNVRLNTETGTAKIALLYARRKGLTPKGGVWGAVFDTLGTLAEDQTSIPPAKPPFPWSS